MKIIFPKLNKQLVDCIGVQYHRYYHIHFKYMLNLFKDAGCEVELVDSDFFENISKTCFEIKINDKLVAIDFSDHLAVSLPADKMKKYVAIFKFHYRQDLHGGFNNMYPFSPVNFQNWGNYRRCLSQVEYKAKGLVLCKQVPGGAALERRQRVQELLHNKYKDKFDKKIENEVKFFLKINEALVSVCVPGARNDMLDRGQGQYMALGCCTISPKLVTVLSYGKQLVPGVHYIECKENYKDLINKIEWIRKNPEKAIEIGQNAKNLFEETSLPTKQVEWIKKCISDE